MSGRAELTPAMADRSGVMLPRLASVLLAVVLLAAWQVAGTYVPGAKALASTPLLVAERFVEIAGNGVLWDNLLPTLEETFGGLLLGLAVGVTGGVLMARSRFAGVVLDPYVVGINGVPRVALGPFFVVWFGIGILSKVLLAVSIVFVVVLFNTREGIESIDEDLVDALRSMRASRWDMLRYVVIPSLVPWLLASIKIGIGLALTGAVVGELVGASAGLGWYITNSLNIIDMTGAVTALLVMGVLAMLMYYVVLILERRLLGWRTEARARA
ncbi:MAG TPA: ABC transporter permease [Acetobacteraceae bacterium]|nr:ABC transporter permease [Acetobacteraceae bacterium]